MSSTARAKSQFATLPRVNHHRSIEGQRRTCRGGTVTAETRGVFIALRCGNCQEILALVDPEMLRALLKDEKPRHRAA